VSLPIKELNLAGWGIREETKSSAMTFLKVFAPLGSCLGGLTHFYLE
jgi:hypothetical protein